MILPADLPMLHEARRLILALQFSQAAELYEKLAQKYPQIPDLWLDLGHAALDAGDYALADRAYQTAINLEPHHRDRLLGVGHGYAMMRRPEKALACFNAAGQADPQSINPRISRAVLFEKQHHLVESRTAVNECLALHPQDEQARFFSAVLDRREGQLESAERTLRDLLAGTMTHPAVQRGARYELAQILDQAQRPDEAMQLLADAKGLAKTMFDISVFQREYDAVAQARRHLNAALPRDILRFWERNFPAAQRYPTPPLALLGGHPRSGTTLLERVLDTHPSIVTLDESASFSRAVVGAFMPPNAWAPYDANHFNTVAAGPLNAMRQNYLKHFLMEADKQSAGLLVDKNPSPTAMLPLWLRAFPEMRVLIALRDPRDVVLSAYFQNIPLNSISVNFLTLERTARHYADLMDVWLAVRQWEGFAWLETRYEDMVANLEKEGTRVTNFLGLQWHPDQAKFYEKARQKQLYSPTYHDVTQHVYSRTFGRWKPYEKYLAPLMPVLERYVRIFGYETA